MTDVGDWWDYGAQANATGSQCAENRGAQAAESKTDGRLSLGQPMLGQRAPSVAIEMTRQRARIAELQAENAKLRSWRGDHAKAIDDAYEVHQRANALADECGRLRDENTQLLAENARLRRGKR